MTFKIDSNIPAPVAQRIREKGPFAATAATLLLGQSFFAEGRTAKASYAVLSPKHFPNSKFRVVNMQADGVTVETDADKAAGVRVWCVEKNGKTLDSAPAAEAETGDAPEDTGDAPEAE